jgi:integrase
MASIHKQPDRPYWFCAFTNADRKRIFRSTGVTDRKQALEICRTWDKTARLGRTGKLTPNSAREIIAAGVSDIFAAATSESLPNASVRAWCKTWLDAKRIETEASTHKRYLRIVDRFLTCLGARAEKDIAALQEHDLVKYRDREAKELSRATANLSLKVIRMVLASAVRQGMVTRNVGSSVAVLKARGKAKRRAFTIAEIKRILNACGDDVEWRGLVLFACYTGQRLGDLARLTWRAVNLDQKEVAFTTQKTGRRSLLPIMRPLADYLESVNLSDDPGAFVFPKGCEREPDRHTLKPVSRYPRRGGIGRITHARSLWKRAFRISGNRGIELPQFAA